MLLVSFLIAGAVLAEEIRFARYPEISPDGSRIAFSYDGDIWTVPSAGGEAVQVTDHVAYEGYPVWSPDGRRIAFASDRFGNEDVFVVSAGGGEPVRVTFHSGVDIPCDWTSDGEAILFQSRREGNEDLWLAKLDGGTPIRVSGVWLEREAFADLSRDGKKVLYCDNRCTTGWSRRFFNSTDAANILISDFSTGGIRPTPLTDDAYQDLWPHFSPDGREVLFVSGRGGALNIYKMPLAGGAAAPLTSREKDVQWLSLADEVGLLAFASGFDVYTLPLEGGEPRKVEIRLSTEHKLNPVEEKSFAGDVSEFRVSPDGKKAALVVHGEIFVVPAEKGGRARRVTNTPWRESDVAWLSDSRRIVYASDRNGTLDLFTADTKTGEETVLAAGPDNDSKPAVSPDGEWIAFYRGNREIRRIKPDGGDSERVASARFLDLRLEPGPEFSWSPDSRWIAYTAYAPDYHTDIRVRNLEDGTDTLVSYLAANNHRPVWSPDCEFLYFTSFFQENADTYRVRLEEKKPKFEEDRLDSLYEEKKDEEDEESDKEEKKDKDKKKKEEEPKPVVIDFENILLRVEAFPDLANDESEPVFVEKGKTVVFSANVMGERSHDLWSYPADEDAEEKKLAQLTTSEKAKSGLQAVEDAVWYLEEGRVKWYDVAKGKAGALSFEAEMKIDVEADRRQMFQEAWALLDDQFYDPAFHGADWGRVRKEYGAVVTHARNTADFHTLIEMMIGELNASHLDISARGGGGGRETGYLGIDLDDSLLLEGKYRVLSVLPESPASLEESRIEPGEYLLSVDGAPLGRGTNLHELLRGKVGHRVEVEVAANPDGKGMRTVRIRPIARSAHIDLRYDEWERERRRLVDEWSGGRLAYLHIRGMGGGDLVRFRRELVTIAEKKDGAVIDVRYNGGGWISVHLLSILSGETWLMRNFRGEPLTSETKMRSYGYDKPTALIINNHSYSNAEIFAEGWRRLGLGPIVGIPTAGAVIGTGSWTLIDGSAFRKPSWGAYTVDGENLENNGRVPDHNVVNSYPDWMGGRDPQLKRSVDLLLEELGGEK
ncbi:MAG: LpqB family beta-propeller domain-containing protein [Candidatus Eisenbacteria bacterium]